MKITDWKNITISAKEFVTGVAFVFTASGFYYKLYYQQAEKNAAHDTEISNLKAEVSGLKSQIAANAASIKELHEDKIRRDAVEEHNQPYTPMTRIK